MSKIWFTWSSVIAKYHINSLFLFKLKKLYLVSNVNQLFLIYVLILIDQSYVLYGKEMSGDQLKTMKSGKVWEINLKRKKTEVSI